MAFVLCFIIFYCWRSFIPVQSWIPITKTLHSFLRMLSVDERVTLFIRKTLPLGKAKTNITRKHTFQCSLSLSTLKTNLWYSGNIKILSFKCYRVKIWIIYAKFQLKLWYKTLGQLWKKFGFLMFSWGVEVKHLLKMG